MATLSAQDIKTLEQTRQRLAQLTSSLSNLQNQIGSSDPLPPWTSLHTLTQILAQSLLSLSSHLQTHSPLLASTAVYPVPSYPGREQEGLLGQLLRKKLEPKVEEWVEQGQKVGEQVVGSDGEEWRELWEWAAVRGNELARGHEWGGGEESEEEDEEDGASEGGRRDDRMEGVVEGKQDGDAKPLNIDDVLRFLSKGEQPHG